LDLKGEYGNAESLAVLGIQHVHGTKRIARDFDKARKCFKKALEIDPKDQDSNYYMGLMYLLGLGVEINIERALSYFESSTKDSRSLNAIGYIYFKAPDYLEMDPAIMLKYGSIRRNTKKAKEYFEKSAQKGNVNALYNMGCLHLSKEIGNKFSFTDAYEYFKQAAEKGHTLSAYNVAIMHFLGVGTFESCQIAQTFLKHVADVGENTQ
jgi:TPR repeat protein